MNGDDWLSDYCKPQSADEFDRRIAIRAAYFAELFYAYAERLVKAGLSSVTISKPLLLNCVESYFVDIQRVKDWHGMERADRFKIAAYTFKWLTKVKPIQIGDVSSAAPLVKKRAMLVNSDFASINALFIAGVNKVSMDEEFTRRLLYTGYYRSVEEGTLAMLLESWARLYPRMPKASGAGSPTAPAAGAN